jgi:hypothetical protein
MAMRQAGFATDKTHSDDEVIYDDNDEDDDAGSSVAAEGSGTTYDNNESEELEEQGESLSHSSKSPCPSSLRDWSEDDDELEPSAALRAIALHDVPDSPLRRHLEVGRLAPRRGLSWLRPSQPRNGRRQGRRRRTCFLPRRRRW